MKTNGKARTYPIPDEVMIRACNLTLQYFQSMRGLAQCCDNWGEAEKCKCREMCGESYQYVETDWIGKRAITLRKAGKLASTTNKKRKKWEPPSGKYKEYLEGDHWKMFRKQVLEFWNWKCCLCPSSKKLEVHHNNYERLGRERLSDCVSLCQECHRKVHGQMKGFPYDRA